MGFLVSSFLCFSQKRYVISSSRLFMFYSAWGREFISISKWERPHAANAQARRTRGHTLCCFLWKGAPSAGQTEEPCTGDVQQTAANVESAFLSSTSFWSRYHSSLPFKGYREKRRIALPHHFRSLACQLHSRITPVCSLLWFINLCISLLVIRYVIFCSFWFTLYLYLQGCLPLNRWMNWVP